ncbi:phenoxybenzoate dioxygenase subunit beta [Coniochaeta ligniaria NRRL 30616]|uniref:Phenoxybenzoate dioxygenase subunit beta n=1 Tax=Coniochaeta ligniaria NRRL 30616 TaxID=1408157 RepID=A0A1J7INB1_9PEZI|nr:phenoxybenzoate dioxygenase subunit beta [Coniochaeta ligniaria NRRL 30616]
MAVQSLADKLSAVHLETPDPPVDLDAPFTSDKILEVRRGRMTPLPGLKILSGIDKSICGGPVHVGPGGIVDDEHDYTFHGGPDKAVHGYCSSHYATWQREFPSAAEHFRPGGFGENLVVAHMNERNVCIGDLHAVGDELVLQVSLPRQPCFKLNHRFRVKNFAPNTTRTSRTGWYYRVVREGEVKAGDEIRLVGRSHPKWTIERVQEYLHRNQGDGAMNEELAGIEELGEESRGMFRNRVAKARAKARKESEVPKWRDFVIVEKKKLTPRISSFVLEAVEPLADGRELDEGSHAKIKLGNGLVRNYSVVQGDRNKFELAVALEEKSRGGSRYFHDAVEVGHALQVGTLTMGIPRKAAASNHIFVAGGIGITAFLAVIEAAVSINYSCVLHYAVRSGEEVPYRERLEKLGDRVILYDGSKGQRLSIPDIVGGMSWNSQLYFCGPKRLMDEAARVTREKGVSEAEVHFEAFEADVSGDPFEVVVANRDNRSLKVGEEETLLEVLKQHFDEVDSSCEVGNCGTCKITLLEGDVEHRGTGLLQEEKATSMLSCVSRGRGRIVVEI